MHRRLPRPVSGPMAAARITAVTRDMRAPAAVANALVPRR
jgi:hypothetical protein